MFVNEINDKTMKNRKKLSESVSGKRNL